MPLGKKYCGGCKSSKETIFFSRSRVHKDGLTTQCKGCNAIRGKEWRKNNPERNKETMRRWHEQRPNYERDRNYRRMYGISLEEAIVIIEGQGWKCAICGVQLKFGKRENAAHLDHDHKTKKVRGFLCYACNHGLGNFRDNVELLKTAIKYVK